MRWAASSKNPGRHYPVTPGRLRQNPQPDLWKFASSAYERKKYAVNARGSSEAATPALEIGCSIGVLTYDLAMRRDALLALDAVIAPLGEAQCRCAALLDARLEQMFVPEQ